MLFPTDFAQEIFDRKYKGTLQDADAFYRTLADTVALGDQELAGKFHKMLTTFRFSPGGRILAYNGRQNSRMSLINCTTHQVEDDSLESISEAAYTIMMASSRGQGIGLDLSKLRPKDAPVNNAAVTSTGAVSFMEMLNHVGGTIGQDGRRAALLFSLSVDHPDIWRKGKQDAKCPKCSGSGCDFCDYSGHISYDFLHVKSLPGHVESANISVLLSDAFMEAVRKDIPWTMRYEGDSGGESFRVETTVRAVDLFKELAENAWRAAEPGVLFADTARRMSNSDLFGKRWKVVGTNACQPAIATVLTPEGIKTMGEISEGSVIMGKNGWTTVLRKWSTGVKPVHRYTTSKGEFIGTEDHKVFQKGVRTLARDAETIDTAAGVLEPSGEFSAQAVMDGLLVGDGSFHAGCVNPHLYIGSMDEDYLTSEVADLIVGIGGVDTNARAYYVKSTLTISDLPKTYERVVPAQYFRANPDKMASFLRGLFSANGYVVRIDGAASRVGLKQTSHALIKQVQQMLSALGITSYVTVSKAKKIAFDNGEYDVKEAYDLNLSPTQAEKFMDVIGFIQAYKNDAYVPPAHNQYSHPTSRGGKVQSVELLGDMEVFDITVDDKEHAYWTGGLLVSNCSEMLLDQDGVCNLGSTNLGRYIVHPYTDDAYLDTNALCEDVRTAVEFLDNVQDIELRDDRSISKKQRESIVFLRRVGLGVAGYADALVKLGLRYAANEDTLTATSIMFGTIRDAAYQASIDLAKRKGPSVAWKGASASRRREIVEGGFYATLQDGLKDQIVEHGLRNVTLLSIAPTGTISNLLGASSGIEPLFAHEYTRRVRINGKDEFVQYVHPGVEETRLLGIPDSVWDTSYTVSPEDHILIQAEIQKYVDSSISKTVNLPKDATVQDVARVYMLAWKNGLKGCTVYRDESRSEQVLYAKKAVEDDACPSCGEPLVHKDGCAECLSCGYGKCSL